MNEKLKEFADEAFQVFNKLDENYDEMFAKFAELVINECLTQCEDVAADARLMTQSKFVTDSGRMLHEGMWGGAKNSASAIKRVFSINE